MSKLRISRSDAKKIKAKLRCDGQVTLRLVNSGERFEFVNKRFVTIAPRYNFEKRQQQEKRKMVIVLRKPPATVQPEFEFVKHN